jgi:hypothetical protein
VQDNPQFFGNPLQFEIQYECLQNLADGAHTHATAPPHPPSPTTFKRKLKGTPPFFSVQNLPKKQVSGLQPPPPEKHVAPPKSLTLTLPPPPTSRRFILSRPNVDSDLEWKLTYVGSAESDKHDQVLDTVLVGPVAQGSYKFVFQAGVGIVILLTKHTLN